ncbi:MAG: 4-hydroxy-4-methyl-2-oxoglutarate aldolase [Chloroflexota bacterium]|nr:4-hydroxy-4-methyl-2-oxoglutarate aldolase [Chloroflexota bacterium]
MDGMPDWLNSTLASDAAEGRNVLGPSIQSLRPGALVVGPAVVVQACQDDNQAVVRAIGMSPARGSVLVVGGMETSRTATVGGLYALELDNLGVIGLITDGLIRDAAEIREMDLAVWCRGVTPIASLKQNPGTVGGSTHVGGTLVRDGDVVIADDDGVVVWPQEQVPELLKRAKAKLDSDNERLARLQAARTTARV